MRFDYILNHDDLERLWGSEIPLPSEKGYPDFLDGMVYWAAFDGDEIVAYTGSKPFGLWSFVGNTYVKRDYRKDGLHSKLLKFRNEHPILKNKEKITILNPIEESKKKHLVKVVERLGYRKITHYFDVEDIMDYATYKSLKKRKIQEIWRI